MQALGRQFTAYQADFSQRASLDAFIQQVSARFPVIDILINKAGTIKRAPAAKHGDELWDEVLRISPDAPFRPARAIGGQMLRQGSGTILTVDGGWMGR